MGRNEKKSYLEQIRLRYRKAGKQIKKKILDEFCAVCEYHRKHAIRILGQPFRRVKKEAGKRGKKSIYGNKDILEALTRIWLATDQMCSKKLKAALPLWLPHYENTYGILTSEVHSKLLTISAATIDRLLKPVKVNRKHKGLCGTKPGSLLKNQIPIRTGTWDINKPGFCEADTVAHCGNSLEGDFVWSITLTDICCCWTENRAVWNKGADGVVKQINDIENNLPFPLLGFDCDNGTEFLNYHLIKYFSDRPKDLAVQFTRSRPYHKDDNAHVEQKNWTHVRQLLGYSRFGKQILVELMNDLYKNEWSFLQNHFHPAMKLIHKERINSKYRKSYDEPKTPYQRLLEHPDVTVGAKQRLQDIHRQLNPFKLKQIIQAKLKLIFKHIS